MGNTVGLIPTTPVKFSPDLQAQIDSGAISQIKVAAYREFLLEVENRFMNHRIILKNDYCEWFAKGEMSLDHLSHFIIQFSVFSNLFLVAQLKKMINATTIEAMHASKEILANELGAIFLKTTSVGEPRANLTDHEKEMSGDPALVSTEGTVDGGVFKFKAAHFEWLLKIGAQLGLSFNDMGKARHGTESTLFFCSELERLYGGEEPSVAEGASFAVENWAAAGFWRQLVQGLQRFKRRAIPTLSLAFFTWHDKVEAQHAAHTQDELDEVFFADQFDKNKFLDGGAIMLEGVAAFWDGLNRDRLTDPDSILA